jgi:hypothetical protein
MNIAAQIAPEAAIGAQRRAWRPRLARHEIALQFRRIDYEPLRHKSMVQHDEAA